MKGIITSSMQNRMGKMIKVFLDDKEYLVDYKAYETSLFLERERNSERYFIYALEQKDSATLLQKFSGIKKNFMLKYLSIKAKVLRYISRIRYRITPEYSNKYITYMFYLRYWCCMRRKIENKGIAINFRVYFK